MVKQCPVCGIKYRVSYRLRNIKKTCSPSCGQKLKNKNSKTAEWIEKAIELRKEGMILSDIAIRVNRSITTVWKQLKMKGIK